MAQRGSWELEGTPLRLFFLPRSDVKTAEVPCLKKSAKELAKPIRGPDNEVGA